MRNKSIKIDILADEINDIISIPDGDIYEAINLLKKEFPELSNNDLNRVLSLAISLIGKTKKENVEIVTTTPASFKTNTRRTYPVIEELISSATGHIVITGYSVSEYFDEMLDLINIKSKKGVVVELFLNNYEKDKIHLEKIKYTDRNFFRVYSYESKDEDKIASLHAKTIIVDSEKLLISSANLSYHGMIGNIEVGVLIESKEKSQQVLNVYKELIKNKMFKIRKTE